MIDAIEVVMDFAKLEDVSASFESVRKMPVYLGGIYWKRAEQSFRLQVYLQDSGGFAGPDCLPTGCRAVQVTDELAPLLGIVPPKPSDKTGPRRL